MNRSLSFGLAPLCLLASALVFASCGKDEGGEGTEAGDCTDDADNDGDGLFDCDDPGCAGASACDETENTPPTAPEISISPATPTTDDILNCVIDTESTDTDGDTVTYSYAWTKDGADAGVTEATVASESTAGEEVWECTVTPNDGIDDGATGSASATIEAENTPPTAPVVSISPSEPTTDDILNCVIDTESTDADGDTVTYSYAWTKDGVDAGVTEATVASEDTAGEEEWICTVTPNDGEDDGAAGVSSVTIEAEKEYTIVHDGDGGDGKRWKIQRQGSGGDELIVDDVVNIDVCATLCANETTLTCNGFMFKDGSDYRDEREFQKGACVLMSKLVVEETRVEDVFSCRMD